MTGAERIREYFRDHPLASYDEVEKATNTQNARVTVHRDIGAGWCIRNDADGSLDYSNYFNRNKSKVELTNWKNENDRHMVEMLLQAAEMETSSEMKWRLIREASRIMKGITQ